MSNNSTLSDTIESAYIVNALSQWWKYNADLNDKRLMSFIKSEIDSKKYTDLSTDLSTRHAIKLEELDTSEKVNTNHTPPQILIQSKQSSFQPDSISSIASRKLKQLKPHITPTLILISKNQDIIDDLAIELQRVWAKCHITDTSKVRFFFNSKVYKNDKAEIKERMLDLLREKIKEKILLILENPIWILESKDRTEVIREARRQCRAANKVKANVSLKAKKKVEAREKIGFYTRKLKNITHPSDIKPIMQSISEAKTAYQALLKESEISITIPTDLLISVERTINYLNEMYHQINHLKLDRRDDSDISYERNVNKNLWETQHQTRFLIDLQLYYYSQEQHIPIGLCAPHFVASGISRTTAYRNSDSHHRTEANRRVRTLLQGFDIQTLGDYVVHVLKVRDTYSKEITLATKFLIDIRSNSLISELRCIKAKAQAKEKQGSQPISTILKFKVSCKNPKDKSEVPSAPKLNPYMVSFTRYHFYGLKNYQNKELLKLLETYKSGELNRLPKDHTTDYTDYTTDVDFD